MCTGRTAGDRPIWDGNPGSLIPGSGESSSWSSQFSAAHMQGNEEAHASDENKCSEGREESMRQRTLGKGVGDPS